MARIYEKNTAFAPGSRGAPNAGQSRQGSSAGSIRHKAITRLVIALVAALLAAVVLAKTLNNPQIQQGANGTFTALGSEFPSSGPGWQVVNPAGTQVGSSASPGGWSVSYSLANNSLTVAVPTTAPIGTGYKARVFDSTQDPNAPHSGLFDVVSGQTTVPPPAPLNLQAAGSNNAVTLSWSASPNATSYTLRRADSAGGTPTYQVTALAGTTHIDTTVVNNTTYYYTVVAVNSYGTSDPSNEVAGTPQATSTRFDVAGIHETRQHQVTVTLTVTNAGPTSSSSSSVQNGVTYYNTSSTAYYICTDTTMNDQLIAPPGVTLLPFTLQTPGGASYTMSGLSVSSNSERFRFQSSSTGGPAQAFLVQESIGERYHFDGGGNKVTDGYSNEKWIVQREKYSVLRLNASAVSVGSRRTYGQPNLAGELPGDPNAELRNPSYHNWVYKGGYFVGHAPYGSGDLSGTTRIQAYVANPPAFTEPVWSAFSIIYLGIGGSFTNAPTITLSVPAANDPNINVAMSSARWSNAWSLLTAAPRSDLTLDSTLPPEEYACFQNPGFAPKMVIHLKNEAQAIDQGISYWRYFASLGYATGSAMTTTDAQPRIWIVDRLERVPAL